MPDDLSSHRTGNRPPAVARRTSRSEPAALRLHRPQDLIEAVPYLLGFRPRDSIVLIGIEGLAGTAVTGAGRVRITARMDIADLREVGPAGEFDDRGAARAASAIRRSGASSVVVVVFIDGPAARSSADEATARVATACADAGLNLGQLLVVDADADADPGTGHDADLGTGCDPDAGGQSDSNASGGDAGGRKRTSRVAAEATYAGLVALDDRRDLVDLLNPEPASLRMRFSARLDTEQQVMRGVGPEGRRRRRGAIRALFAATRTLAVVNDVDLVRFGAALSTTEVRDACWLAVEAGRIDGEPLWRELGRRLPGPYDAAPLFLFGWQRWRHGDGVLAGIAARRALDSDAGYTAAHLLDTAVTDGLDPYRTPRLRKGA